MKNISLLLTLCGLLVATQTMADARVQVIHNSADAAAAQVDVWLNDILLLDDFAFRTASPFVDAPAGVPIVVSICPPSSIDTTSAIAQFTYTLTDLNTYIIVANGIVSTTGYMPNVPFDLYVYDMGREVSNGGSMMTDLVVFHGSTDAPTVDVHEETAGELADDVMYGTFAGYLELPTADYTVQVRNETNSAIVAAYGAPLSSLSLGGTALTVLASGFLDPSMNSGGPAFGLYVATAAGGPLLPLPAAPIPTASVQVIHNSADAAAAVVDVWLNNDLLIDDFAFRTASPFVQAQAGVPFDVSISLPTSTDTTGAVARFTYTLAADENYVLVANGIVSGSGYMPIQPFDVYVYAGARQQAAQAGNVDLLVFHGATDAPTVDVDEVDVLNTTLVPAISYGEFQGYVEAPEDDYTLSIVAGGNTVATYQAPLATLGLAGNSLTVLASGFLDPMMNSNGPGFGLYAATAAGGPLVELPLVTSVDELNDIIGGSTLWPNPSNGMATLQLDVIQDVQVNMSIVDLMGRTVKNFGSSSLSVGPNIMDLDVNILADGMYFVTVATEAGIERLPLQRVR